jgi:hypothetical protein
MNPPALVVCPVLAVVAIVCPVLAVVATVVASVVTAVLSSTNNIWIRRGDGHVVLNRTLSGIEVESMPHMVQPILEDASLHADLAVC